MTANALYIKTFENQTSEKIVYTAYELSGNSRQFKLYATIIQLNL